MRVLLMILGLLGFIWAKSAQKDMYIEYTNKIINYNFQLKELDKIKTPFYLPFRRKITQKTPIIKNLKKSVKISLVSIFGNKALIKVQKFIGQQEVSEEKRWISLNQEIYGCKLTKLTFTDAVFKCKDKTLHKSLNKKIPLLRDGK